MFYFLKNALFIIMSLCEQVMCLCRAVYGDQRAMLCSRFFPSVFMQILGLEVALPNAYSKHLSLLSPLASPRFVKLSMVPLFPLISAPSENVVMFHKTSLLLLLMCIELIV